jgi:ATP-binding cassette subfamily F protein 3
MALAALSNIEKTFGERVIFKNLNLIVDRGERLGLIGDNGAGKSTIFKMLIGQLKPDVGSVAINKGTKVGHLTQDPVFDHDNTVMDEAELAFADLHRLAHLLRDLEHKMAEVEGDALDAVLEKYTQVQGDFDLAGGYAWQHKLEATLQGVGLPKETWEQSVGTLSGGQKSRLALAKILIAEPDLLLLDEPTNHLDLAAIEWLENYLLQYDGAAIIISHDRYLLDRLATRIAWLTRSQINSYPGSYSAFEVQRELHELSQQRAFEKQQADIDKQDEFVRRFKAGQRARQAKGREKRLNALLSSDKMIDAVTKSAHIHVSIQTDQRAGDRVLAVKELSKSFDDKKLWNNLKFEIKRGERVGIIGPNGAGKSTLLKVLLAEMDADGGEIKWGSNLNVGYYDQTLGNFDPELTIFEEVQEESGAKDNEVRSVLGTLLFTGDDHFKQIKLLSGGERARVRLAELLLEKPNVLVLDEPTNHLDIASCGALEKTLKEFNGTIICVSHDRYFLDHAVDRLFIITPPDLDDFDGNYTKWAARERARAQATKEAKTARDRAQSKSQPKAQAKPVSPPPQQKPAGKKNDNPYMRPYGKLSMKDLEKQIADTEVAMGQHQQQLSQVNAFKDAAKGKRVQTEYAELEKKLKALEEEYYAREA